VPAVVAALGAAFGAAAASSFLPKTAFLIELKIPMELSCQKRRPPTGKLAYGSRIA
jgi:hypothetical protein